MIVYTPEVYPTKMRAVAMGFGSASARIGAMITPYIAQVLLRKSLYAAVAVYAGLGEKGMSQCFSPDIAYIHRLLFQALERLSFLTPFPMKHQGKT